METGKKTQTLHYSYVHTTLIDSPPISSFAKLMIPYGKIFF